MSHWESATLEADLQRDMEQVGRKGKWGDKVVGLQWPAANSGGHGGGILIMVVEEQPPPTIAACSQQTSTVVFSSSGVGHIL